MTGSRQRRTVLLIAVLPWLLAAAPNGWEDALLEWRAERVASLRSEDSWLTLIALRRLEPGALTIGSSAEVDVPLPVGAELSGTLTVDERSLWFEAAEGAEVLVASEPIREIGLADDSDGEPTVLTVGRVSLHVIERGGVRFLRVKDPRSDARAEFAGLDHYPPAPEWRFDARFEVGDPSRTVEVANVVGVVSQVGSWGDVVFEIDGTEHRLAVLADPGAERLFIIFSDETNRDATYGAGRYLYADAPDADGRVEVDFNRAYNPPCAFTAYATCPLPPRGNDLPVAVTAGERRYALDPH